MKIGTKRNVLYIRVHYIWCWQHNEIIEQPRTSKWIGMQGYTVLASRNGRENKCSAAGLHWWCHNITLPYLYYFQKEIHSLWCWLFNNGWSQKFLNVNFGCMYHADAITVAYVFHDTYTSTWKRPHCEPGPDEPTTLG